MEDRDLIHITYVSRAIPEVTEESLREILTEARERNLREGITGMLLYRDGHFMQVLEGTQESVEDVFELILSDPRHDDVYKTLEEPIEARAFPDWQMGFKAISENSEEPQAFLDIAQESPEGIFSRVKDEDELAVRILAAFLDQDYLPPFASVNRDYTNSDD